MATTQNPLLCGPLSRIFLFVLFLMQVWTGGRLVAQEVQIAIDEGATLSDGTVLINVTGHGAFLDSLRDIRFPPHVRFLYIFGDGNFLNGVKDSSQFHRYPYTSQPMPSEFELRTYHTPIYSGGKPPPKRASITPPPIPAPVSIKSVVGPGRRVHLQRNQDVGRKDTIVSILSFKNTTTDTLDGQIYLFFNDDLKIVETSERGGTVTTPLAQRATFKMNEMLSFSPRIIPDTYIFNNSSSKFDRGAMLEYRRLSPGEEIHLFFEMEHDPVMFSAFTGEKKTTTDIAAIMTSFEQVAIADSITSLERDFINSLDFDSILDRLGNPQLEPFDTVLNNLQGNLSFDGDLAKNIVDATVMSAELVKAHDPNQVIAEACACTDKNDVQKVVITVDCENDGSAPTEIVIIEVFIPAQLDFNSIAAQPISYLPALSLTGGRSITMTKDAARRSIIWTMEGFHLMGTQVVGFGNPLSQGQIVFTALTNAGVALSAIDSIHACIRFSETAGPNDIVCTPKAAVHAIWDGPDTQGQLQCLDDCKCPPWKIPRWLWYVLVGLILLIALIRWWRNNNP